MGGIGRGGAKREVGVGEGGEAWGREWGLEGMETGAWK